PTRYRESRACLALSRGHGPLSTEWDEILAKDRAIVTGVLEIVAAVHLHRAHGEWLLVLNGVLSVLFGLLVIVWPGAGVLTLPWMLGAYTIFFGVLLVALAVRLRSHHHRQSSAVA